MPTLPEMPKKIAGSLKTSESQAKRNHYLGCYLWQDSRPTLVWLMHGYVWWAHKDSNLGPAD